MSADYDDLSKEVNALLAANYVLTQDLPTGMLNTLWRVDMDRVRLRDLLAAELKKPVDYATMEYQRLVSNKKHAENEWDIE